MPCPLLPQMLDPSRLVSHTVVHMARHTKTEPAKPPRERPPYISETGKWVTDIDGPIGRAVVFSRPVRGFDSRELSLLGPLHVELSSGHRWNHPPLKQPALPPVPADRVEVSFVFTPSHPHSPKKEHAGTTHTYSSARRYLYSDGSTGGPVRYSKGSMGGPTNPLVSAGIEPPPSRQAPSALPLGQRPPPQGSTAGRACTHTRRRADAALPSPCIAVCGPPNKLVDLVPPPPPCAVHSRRHSDLLLFCLCCPEDPLDCCAYMPLIVCAVAVCCIPKLTNHLPALRFSLSLLRVLHVTDDISQVPFQVHLYL